MALGGTVASILSRCDFCVVGKTELGEAGPQVAVGVSGLVSIHVS